MTPELDNRFSRILLYNTLRSQIIYHKYLYYVLDTAEIGDDTYDALEKQFDHCARELGREGSWVGYDRRKNDTET